MLEMIEVAGKWIELNLPSIAVSLIVFAVLYSILTWDDDDGPDNYDPGNNDDHLFT